MTPHQARDEAAVPGLLHDRETVRAFRAFIEHPSFPCLGAKATLERNALDCVFASDIRSASDDRHITQQLQSFASKAREDDVFVSLALLFPGSPLLSEIEFETALWHRLQAMHAIDRAEYNWDDRVSADPASPYFSMSVGGKGFFVIGMHPRASRPARRFQCPAMIFNLHSQFEHLRADRRYEKLQRAIAARDVMFSGSANPMLAAHGQRSEARQYSGRAVGEDWICPFAPIDQEHNQ